MNVIIYPSTFSGTISAPSSKSLTHRAIICAALASTPSKIINPLKSDDTNATLNALKLLGVNYWWKDNILSITPPQAYNKITQVIDCQASGSTIRFLIPVLLHFQNQVTFQGTKRLLERINMADLNQIGINASVKGDLLTVNCMPFSEDLVMNDQASSQLISGVLMMAPLMSKKIAIKITSPTLDPYIALTISVMKSFGINCEITYHTASIDITIDGKKSYHGTTLSIEGDYSHMANFFVCGALSGTVTINNLSTNSLQGDSAIIEILKQANASVITTSRGITINNANLQPLHVDLTHIPDLGPILMALASTIKGTSTFTSFLRLIKKESNRLLTTINILRQLGAQIALSEDILTITGCDSFNGDITLNPDNDHRLVMMIASLASRFNKPIIIEQSEAINKSYPSFWQDYQTLGGKIKWED